MNLVQRVYIKI